MNRKIQKLELDGAIVTALVEEPHKSYLKLAKQFGTSVNYVVGIVQQNGLERKRGRGSSAWPAKTPEVG